MALLGFSGGELLIHWVPLEPQGGFGLFDCSAWQPHAN